MQMPDFPQFLIFFFLFCSVTWMKLGEYSGKHASKLPLEKSKAFPRLCVAMLHNWDLRAGILSCVGHAAYLRAGILCCLDHAA